MLAFERIAEERIREAIDAGEFDNLQSKGKPLNLDEYSSVPADQRLVYLVLKNTGFMPSHLHYRRELEMDVEALQSFRDQCRTQFRERLEALRSALAAQSTPKINNAATHETLTIRILLLLHHVFSQRSRQQIERPPSSRTSSPPSPARLASLRRAYQYERRWRRARLQQLARNAEDTAQLLEETLIEKETRDRKPYLMLLGVPFISAKAVLDDFDRDYPATM